METSADDKDDRKEAKHAPGEATEDKATPEKEVHADHAAGKEASDTVAASDTAAATEEKGEAARDEKTAEADEAKDDKTADDADAASDTATDKV